MTGAESGLGAAEQRRRAAADRAAAAEALASAAADREHAALDREQAARDRLQAQADRERLLVALELSELDNQLTGVRTRPSGAADTDRARPATGAPGAARDDAIGLSRADDRRGHAAGDAVPIQLGMAIRAHVRSYELILRLGGDEFLRAMSNASLDETRERLARIAAALTGPPQDRDIKTEFAEDNVGRHRLRADRVQPP